MDYPGGSIYVSSSGLNGWTAVAFPIPHPVQVAGRADGTALGGITKPAGMVPVALQKKSDNDKFRAGTRGLNGPAQVHRRIAQVLENREQFGRYP